MSEEMKNNDNKKISRREAIKKAGKYAAITSMTMMVLSPRKAAATSVEPESAPSPEETFGTEDRSGADSLNWWLP